MYKYYRYTIQYMNRSRRRQFDQFRSHANSVRSQTTSLRSSKISVINSNVSEACVNCVNKIIATRHKKQEQQQKIKTKQQFNKNQKLMNSWFDDQDNYRNNMKKQALNHNSRMIQQHQQVKKHEKEDDIKYSENLQKTITQAELNMQKQVQAQKRRHNQYYQQIHNQYVNQLQKRDRQRFNKERQQGDQHKGLPLYNQDLTEQKIRYKRELQVQMQQRKQKQQQQKLYNQRKQKQILQQSKRQADKYHADNYQSLKMSKQEVFDGLRNLQVQKKCKIQQQRKNKQQDRMKQIKQQNELRSKAIKLKMQEMQNYVQGLKHQLLQREQKLKANKLYDSKFQQKFPKSTEQIDSQLSIKKTCKSCHKNYPQQFIGPIPKKV